MVHDRVDGDDLHLTQEFISITLAVRRAGITAALHELQRKGLLSYRRTLVTIVDRRGLEASSNGAYRREDDSARVDAVPGHAF